MDKPTFVGVLLAAVVTSLVSVMGYERWVKADDESDLRVAIIDVADVINHAREGGYDADDNQRMVDAIQRASRRMAEQGYVVVDQKAVLDAPSSYKVDTEKVVGMIKKPSASDDDDADDGAPDDEATTSENQ